MNFKLSSTVLLCLSTALWAAEMPVTEGATEEAAVTAPLDGKSAEPIDATHLKSPALKPSATEAPFASAKMEGPVSNLQALLDYHEREIASIKRMMDRWKDKMDATLKRRQSMTENLAAAQKNAADLEQKDAKKNKREISRLHKEAGHIQKDIGGINKELKGLLKEMSNEVRENMGDASGALREAYQQVIREIQQPQI